MAQFLQDIRQGDEYIIKINFGTTNNITGFEFWLTIKSDFDLPDSEAVLQFTTTAGDYSGDDPIHGLVYMVIPSSVTGAAEAGHYFYDLQCKTSTGEITTIVPPVDSYKDRILIAPEVTKATS